MWCLRTFVCCAMILALQACGTTFHYTDHRLLVTDQVSHAPIHNAVVSVRYAPVYCGGPFAFLGSPDIPESPEVTTNADGTAVIPLELEWPYGFTINVTAPGYTPTDFIRPRNLSEPLPPLPDSLALRSSK